MLTADEVESLLDSLDVLVIRILSPRDTGVLPLVRITSLQMAKQINGVSGNIKEVKNPKKNWGEKPSKTMA